VTPETEEQLHRAREYLSKANALLEIVHYGDEAARAAYLAGFHAAQALISERTGRIVKTHRGVRSAFARLTKDDPRLDRTLTQFLGRGYQRKEMVDYGVGPQAMVSEADARDLIESAARFIDVVAEILAEEPPG
jgi:uncharacterized protein (UPF0332 family)